ncbi:MAG: hypothetical protein QOG92_101 [Verrucomicrobiota bacterium]|nr:hypothetical protein [Verrucomicrobiota bacterium]
MFGNILRADQLNFSGGGNLRGGFFMLIERRIAVIGGTSGIGFVVESKGLHSSAW